MPPKKSKKLKASYVELIKSKAKVQGEYDSKHDDYTGMSDEDLQRRFRQDRKMDTGEFYGKNKKIMLKYMKKRAVDKNKKRKEEYIRRSLKKVKMKKREIRR